MKCKKKRHSNSDRALDSPNLFALLAAVGSGGQKVWLFTCTQEHLGDAPAPAPAPATFFCWCSSSSTSLPPDDKGVWGSNVARFKACITSASIQQLIILKLYMFFTCIHCILYNMQLSVSKVFSNYKTHIQHIIFLNTPLLIRSWSGYILEILS